MCVVPAHIQNLPQEQDHQKYVVEWLRSHPSRIPFTAPCNGSHSRIEERAKARSMGMENGVPDLCVFLARQNYHALFIEMKSAVGVLSEQQKDFIERLEAAGMCVAVCRSAQQAINVLLWYLHCVV